MLILRLNHLEEKMAREFRQYRPEEIYDIGEVRRYLEAISERGPLVSDFPLEDEDIEDEEVYITPLMNVQLIFYGNGSLCTGIFGEEKDSVRMLDEELGKLVRGEEILF